MSISTYSNIYLEMLKQATDFLSLEIVFITEIHIFKYTNIEIAAYSCIENT